MSSWGNPEILAQLEQIEETVAATSSHLNGVDESFAELAAYYEARALSPIAATGSKNRVSLALLPFVKEALLHAKADPLEGILEMCGVAAGMAEILALLRMGLPGTPAGDIVGGCFARAHRVAREGIAKSFAATQPQEERGT